MPDQAAAELRFEIGDELRPVEGPLSGNTYVITGTLEGFTRDDAAAALEAKGAKVLNSVSRKTTGLIVGEEPGNSKLTKARKVEVPILSEADLVDVEGLGAVDVRDRDDDEFECPVHGWDLLWRPAGTDL